MSIILIILLVILCFISIVLLFALFARKDYNIRREIIINSPKQKVFDYIKHIKNQDNYNKWVMMDPAMKKEFKGIDGTAGFIYAWHSNKKVGQGEQEIKVVTEGEIVEMEIRFIKPFSGVANASMSTDPQSDNLTKVSWNNVSKMKYPMNAMIPFIEKKLSKDMDTSLVTLKNILEK